MLFSTPFVVLLLHSSIGFSFYILRINKKKKERKASERVTHVLFNLIRYGNGNRVCILDMSSSPASSIYYASDSAST